MDRGEIDLLRRDIVFDETLQGQALTFHTRWGLFSPRGVDEGTKLLLDHVEVHDTDRALDLGCGYGPIGLTLARLAPRGRATLVDRDVVAVEYARRNAGLNRLENVDVELGDGFEPLDGRRFDLVASNLPAKAGNEAYYILFADALDHLEAGGRLYVVTISGLRRFIERAFTEVFGNYAKVKQGRTHTVSLAVKGSRSPRSVD